MKMEQVIKDGKCVGFRSVCEAGDKFCQQFGEFIFLNKEPTLKDYEDLASTVIRQVVEHIKDSDKKWDFDSIQFILKSKKDFEGCPDFTDDKIGTLGFKVAISRIVEEGETV